MILSLAGPVAVVRAMPLSAGAFDVPRPAVPLRDTVRRAPGVLSARISATASSDRYPIGDGSDATIAVSVTGACQATCNAATPQAIASFVGTLIHGGEVSLLTVQLDTERQIEVDCGFGAQACYYVSENRIVLNGNDDPAPDGATREFVLAHEYGHHIAQHRLAPSPFAPAIDWGTPRWATYENVCQGQRRRSLFPGNEGSHYYRDPGEAFAESFAYLRFPHAQQRWGWVRSLKPNPAALGAIRRDVLRPWRGRRGFAFGGRLSVRGRSSIGKSFATPLDGRISIWLRGARPGAFRLVLRNDRGRVLRRATRFASGHRLQFTACGQSGLRVAVQRRGRRGGHFRVAVQRP